MRPLRMHIPSTLLFKTCVPKERQQFFNNNGHSPSHLKLSIDHRDCLLQTEICMSPGTTRRFHRHGFRPAANQKPVKTSWGYQNSFCIAKQSLWIQKISSKRQNSVCVLQNSLFGIQNSVCVLQWAPEQRL